MVGDNVRKHPELYQQIVEAGHQSATALSISGGLKHTIKCIVILRKKRFNPRTSLPVLHMDGCSNDHIYMAGKKI